MCNKSDVWFCLLFAFQMRGIKIFDRLRESGPRQGAGVGREVAFPPLSRKMGTFSSAAIYEAKSSWRMGWWREAGRLWRGKGMASSLHSVGTHLRQPAPRPSPPAWHRTPAGRVFFSAHLNPIDPIAFLL